MFAILETLDRKTTKYEPLINSIIARGWNVAPLMVLVACARATTHMPSMNKLETILELHIMKIQSIFKQINIIATQYAHSILAHRRRLENRQHITNLQDLP